MADRVDLVGRHVEPVVALVLQQQVVAFDAADGPLDHAAVAGDAVLVVDDVVALLEVVEEALGVAPAGPGPPVGAAAAGEVGLGQHGQPDAAEHRAALERRHHDLGPDALAGEQVADPGGRAIAVGADHDAVALLLEAHQPGQEAAAVAHHRVPAGRLDLGRVGAVGHADDLPHRRPRVPQQPVEVEVEAREAMGRRPLVGRPPRHGQRGGQVALLGQQVGRPVAHPAGLAQQDLGVVADDVDQQVLVGGEPGQPRLHAVERQALGQPLPLLAAPRLQADEPLGPRPDLGRGQQLTAREDVDPAEVVGRPLVRHRELGQAVDLVAPQVDTDRPVGRRREHVHDRAADRHLAPVLDHLLPPVAGGHQVGHQLVAVDLLARPDGDGLDVLDVGPQPLHQRPHRRHHDVGRSFGVAQAPQHPQAPAHRLDPGADPLEGQGLPGGEQLDPIVAEVGAEVAGQPLRLGRGGNGQHHRAPPGQADETGGDQGAGRLGDRQGGCGAAQHPGEAGLLPQQGGDMGQGRA